MKVRYATIWLAPGGRESAQDVSLNGSQVVQVVQLMRAVASRPIARGNKSDTFTFAVRLAKASRREGEYVAFSQLAILPGSGQLEVTIGAGDDTQILYLDAALQSIERTTVGRSPAMRYTFVGGLFTTDGVTLPDQEGDMIRGTTDLSADDETKAVVFAAELGLVPTTVQCWIVPPDGGDFIDARPRKSTIATTGFTADFAAAIPGAGYVLHWNIVL